MSEENATTTATPPQPPQPPPVTFETARKERREQEGGEGTRLPEGDMGFADAFEASVPLIVSGSVVHVKPLSTEDYTGWCATITKEIQDRRTKAIPQQANALERWKIASNIQDTEFTPDDFAANLFVFRPKWTIDIIVRALENA